VARAKEHKPLWVPVLVSQRVIQVDGIEGLLDAVGHLLDVALGLEGSEMLKEREVGQGVVAKRQGGFFAHL
jgi:hypothetical protein